MFAARYAAAVFGKEVPAVDRVLGFILGLDTQVLHEGFDALTANISNHVEWQNGTHVFFGRHGFGSLLEDPVDFFGGNVTFVEVKPYDAHTTGRVGIVELWQNIALAGNAGTGGIFTSWL